MNKEKHTIQDLENSLKGFLKNQYISTYNERTDKQRFICCSYFVKPNKAIFVDYEPSPEDIKRLSEKGIKVIQITNEQIESGDYDI